MIQELLNNIQDKIQEQIQDKFGLNADQTTQSTSVLLENFKKFFSDDLMSGNFSNIKSMFENGMQNITDNPALQNFQNNVLNDLKTKVGLSDEMASKVKDFQISTLFSTMQKEFLGEDGKPDLSKLMSKFNLDALQEKAQEILGGKIDLGSIFGKK
jgi:hypothetical protein